MLEPIAPDVPQLLRALSEADCIYVMVGGMAAVLHGSPIVTTDCDLAIAFSSENRSKLVQALAPYHPRPLRPAPNWEWDEKCIMTPWTLLMTDLGRVDLLIRLHGIDSFSGLFDRSTSAKIYGVPVRFASLIDLIDMKKGAGRDKDLVHLGHLLSLARAQGISVED